LPTGSAAVIDGLALPGFADCLKSEAERLRLVGFIHHPLAMETGLSATDARHYAALEARLWPLLRGILCPSAHTAKAIIAAGVAAQRVAVAMPGTAKPGIPLERKAQGPLRLLAVGTVTPRKGHLLLIAALAGLRDFDWRLTCIGSLERDPAAAAALRRAIAASELGDRVTLIGERPPELLSGAYRDTDLFVLPSYHEGYGMVYAEALAHGLPCIATTAGAIPDTVPASASLLVPPGDTTALRDALRLIFTDANLRFRLAAGAALAAAALPDWPTAVRRWAAAFDRIAA
jgi:glycosyltransferase involved in cell wall biosynthesis